MKKTIKMTTNIEKCRVRLERNKFGRLELVIDELNPICKKSLEEISDNTGKFERKYLKRVIKTDNPKIRKFLEDIKLK